MIQMYNVLGDSYSQIGDMSLSKIVENVEKAGKNPVSFAIQGRIIGEMIVKFSYNHLYGFCLGWDGTDYVSAEMLESIDEKMGNWKIGHNYVTDDFSVEIDFFSVSTSDGEFEFVKEEKGEL